MYETEAKWFLLENNATMTKENQDIITGIMGVEPIYINSNLLTAQERKRLYWTNIPDIKQPEDKGIFLRDIVQPREEKKEYECYKRMMAKEEGTLAHKKAWSQVKTLCKDGRNHRKGSIYHCGSESRTGRKCWLGTLEEWRRLD